MASQALEKKIMVAVDFGTTFSGLAWAHTTRKRRTVVENWPNANESHDKVPTKLQYHSPSTPNDRVSWGFEVEPDSSKPTYELFKLGLDPGKESQTQLAQRYPSVVTRLPANSETIENLVVDYLKALQRHLEKRISRQPESLELGSLPRQYIITVPAVWSEKAQATTRACAERANMGPKDTINIVSEPEAAAIFVLDQIRDKGIHHFKIGDSFVVCDAGGGTVDLISYTVTQVGPTLELRESTKGEGYVCGGMFVNRIFADYMLEEYGRSPFWSDAVLQNAVREFEEQTKKRFDGRTDRQYPMRVDIREQLPDIRNFRLWLSGSRLKRCFDPVVAEVTGLILAQIRATEGRVNGVLLVGGFGRNEYLYRKVQRAVGDGIKVSQPEGGNTAVVEGALMKGLFDADPANATIRILTRRSRRSYGTSSYIKFIEGFHDATKCEKDNYSGELQVETLQWFVRQNESLRVSKPLPFYWDRGCDLGIPTTLEMTIFSHEAAEDTNTAPPTYPSADGIAQLGKLSVPVSSLPSSAIQTKQYGGKEYFIVNFDVTMTLHSASLAFALVVGGTKYAELTMDFS